MKTYKTEGIILKRTNFGEADRIITLYSKHFGKIKILAKGIRKTTSRKGGNLELFNWVRIFVHKGRNLDIVMEVETIRAFRVWRKDLKKVALAYHFCELVDKLTAEHVPHKEIFDLLAGGLWGLGQAGHKDLKNADRNFTISLLEKTGFWPEGKEISEINLQEYLEKVTEKKMVSKRIFKDFI